MIRYHCEGQGLHPEVTLQGHFWTTSMYPVLGLLYISSSLQPCGGSLIPMSPSASLL